MTSPAIPPSDGHPPARNDKDVKEKAADVKKSQSDKKIDHEKTGKLAESQKIKGSGVGTGTAKLIPRTAIPIPVDRSKVHGVEAFRKQAIDRNIPFFALVKMVTDPDFEKNPNKVEIAELFKQRFDKEKFIDTQKVDFFRKLLSASQSPETIFKNIELLIGNDYVKIFKQLNELFTEKFFSLAFENPKFASEIMAKRGKDFDILQVDYAHAAITKVLFKYCLPGTEHTNNPVVKECLIKIHKSIADDICFDIYESNLPSERLFKVLEMLEPEIFFDNAYLSGMEPFFTKLFISLMFENPTYALELLNKHKSLLSEYRFDFKQLEKMFKIYGDIGIPQNKDQDLAACLTILKDHLAAIISKNNSSIDLFYWALHETVMKCDLPHSFRVLILQMPRDMHYSRSQILKSDSVACLKQLADAKYDCNMIDSGVMDDRSEKCLAFMIDTYGVVDETRNYYLIHSRDNGYIDIMLVLLKNKLNEVSKLVFSNLIPLLKNPAPYQKKIEEELTAILVKLFRMNPIESVERIVQNFMTQNSAAADLFPDIYRKAKEELLRIAPFISRHTKGEQIKAIRFNYSDKTKVDPIAEEIKYAKYCRKQVDIMNEGLKNNQIKRPASKEFNGLPASSTGTRRVAALTEKIGELRWNQQKARSNKISLDNLDITSFKTLRTHQMRTAAENRYEWASPLIHSVEIMSNAADIIHGTEVDLVDKFDPTKIITKRSYDLMYNGKVLNKVAVEKIGFSTISALHHWYHGYSGVKESWKAVEDTFEKLMAFNLKKPAGNNPAAQKKYEQQLDEFYRTTAELVWLIGNTTPLIRGSGTVAEWLLGIVCLHNGLEPPVLKTQFPQLDVLDITFPLSDYKDFFTYFFEPSSLPPHIKWPDLSSKTTFEQMHKLYTAKHAGRLEKMRSGQT